ncbi:MAG TPA: glycosyltransferase family 4 protein [Terriglobales bacterium]|nr:glycosyltransferase family 4 protein [Terriglobales bacterium]
MRILWVKPGKILPLDTGGKLRTYNMLCQLAANHQLAYLSFYGGEPDCDYESEIARQLPGTIPLRTGILNPHSAWAEYFDYLCSLPGRAPYAVSKYTSRQVRTWLGDRLARPNFDIAVCDFLCTSLNFPQRLGVPTVLFQHNVESVLWKRKAQGEVKWLDRMISKLEYAKMRRFEPEQVRRFDHVIAVSEQDREAMSSMVDPAAISVIPTGVDLAKYRYQPDTRPAEHLVVFVGSMDWEANIDGVEFFCDQVWPRVVARVPKARFRIVGRNPHPRVKKLVSPSVEVSGSVPSTVDHLREAAVIVVPLRMGSGTRIKIYEGMAMGKATVSTRVGAEGLDVHHGQDILLADDPQGLADSICTLLGDESLRRRIEAAAHHTASQYDWSVVTERFVEILEATIERTRRRSAGPPVSAISA